VGAPGGNMEVKIVAIEHDAEVDETITDPIGTVFYRGPSVGEPIPPLAS